MMRIGPFVLVLVVLALTAVSCTPKLDLYDIYLEEEGRFFIRLASEINRPEESEGRIKEVAWVNDHVALLKEQELERAVSLDALQADISNVRSGEEEFAILLVDYLERAQTCAAATIDALMGIREELRLGEFPPDIRKRLETALRTCEQADDVRVALRAEVKRLDMP